MKRGFGNPHFLLVHPEWKYLLLSKKGSTWQSHQVKLTLKPCQHSPYLAGNGSNISNSSSVAPHGTSRLFKYPILHDLGTHYRLVIRIILNLSMPNISSRIFFHTLFFNTLIPHKREILSRHACTAKETRVQGNSTGIWWSTINYLKQNILNFNQNVCVF